MILAIDTSSAACSVALLGTGGEVVARRDESIGRGHAERLAPLIAELLDGHVPNHIICGVGPGSFTGIRVGLACAEGLAIGWNVPICGMDSLALTAAAARGSASADEEIAVAIHGGHGELFVRRYDRETLAPLDAIRSLKPDAAAQAVASNLVAGSGATALVTARGSGEALDVLPSAAFALHLPEHLRGLDAKPAYARAPDAKPARAMAPA